MVPSPPNASIDHRTMTWLRLRRSGGEGKSGEMKHGVRPRSFPTFVFWSKANIVQMTLFMDWKNKALLGLSVLRYQVTGQRTPVAVAWLITGRCNLNCCYCKWKDERQSDELDTAAVKRLIDQMKAAGVRLISFTGGEPLVRGDMGEIIRYVKSHGLVCKLNSNGMLVQQRLDDLRPLDLLQISVDGPPQVQDQLRGAGTRRAGFPRHPGRAQRRYPRAIDRLPDPRKRGASRRGTGLRARTGRRLLLPASFRKGAG